MALPKEPRQKMINMMYLVLTALLALNVSAEILNAFKTVNNSITKANSVIGDKNSTTYKSFEDKLKDPKSQKDAAEWYPKAQQSQKLSQDLFTYLEELKVQLKKEADLKVENGVESFKEDNLEAATRLFVTNGKGKELLERLTKYRNDMLNIVPDKKSEFDKSFPLDLKTPVSQDGTTGRTWEYSYFNMTPTIAALTILSKFQNDVKNTEAQVTDYCHSKVGAVVVKYDEFAAIASASSTYLFPGQPLEVYAGVGAFSNAAKPTVTVNGNPVPVDAKGMATYKTVAGGAGTSTLKVKVSFTRPDGTPGVEEKDITYTVGVPSGAAVMLDKMNVFYIGVDNPVTISSGAGDEKTSVSMNGGSISKVGTGKYTVRVSNPGNATINVSADGKSTPFQFRVKRIPDPRAKAGNLEPGRIAASTFKAQGGILAILENFDFAASFTVQSYKVYGAGKNFPDIAQASVGGPAWGSAQSIIDRSGPGSTITIDDIRVVGPDGQSRKLPAISYVLF
jgi:gliding motility-associated protein GldM